MVLTVTGLVTAVSIAAVGVGVLSNVDPPILVSKPSMMLMMMKINFFFIIFEIIYV